MRNSHWNARRTARRQQAEDGRDDYDVDYARVVHSSSFRRLAGKTQIHQGDSDVPRNRLTHSIEVSQIALGIAQRLKNADADGTVSQLVSSHSLVQVIGLCHDLGHPCGGHAGEDALNACLPYEGNGQTLRILTRLEGHTPDVGLNLTRRTLLGVLKYPVPYSRAKKRDTPPPRRGISGQPLIGPEHKPPKCYLDSEADTVDWMLAPFESDRAIVEGELLKTFDASLMDLADDFAYSAADLDDAIALNMMKREWLELDAPEEYWLGFMDHMEQQDDRGQTWSYDRLMDALMGSGRKKMTGLIINYLLSGVRVYHDERMHDELYRYRVTLDTHRSDLVDILKKSVFRRVIEAPSVQLDRVRIQKQIIDVYDAMTYRPMMYLPEKHRDIWNRSDDRERVVADYIAGMTDRFLAKTHSSMFG
jgi:dGTPase